MQNLIDMENFIVLIKTTTGAIYTLSVEAENFSDAYNKAKNFPSLAAVIQITIAN